MFLMWYLGLKNILEKFNENEQNKKMQRLRKGI